MSGVSSTREIILGVLLEINRDGEYSHIAIRNALDKYQYLPKQDRAFITRVCEGTVEYMLQMDYIIGRFSSVKVEKMKPVIREILRSSVYQLIYMDRIPDSAVCNEAVKLAQKKGFRQLKRLLQSEGICQRRAAKHCQKQRAPGFSAQKPAGFLSVGGLFPACMAGGKVAVCL